MSEIEDIFIHAWNKDAVNLKPALDDILSAKVAEKIDAMTVDTASNMFNGDPDEVDQPEEQDDVEVDNDDASLDIDSDESVDDLYIDSEEEDSTDYEGTEDADQSETDSEE